MWFVIFAIGCDIIFEAASNILGGRESMPVAFLGFRDLRCSLMSFSVTGLKLKIVLFVWCVEIFDILGCCLFTGVLLFIPMLLAIFT